MKVFISLLLFLTLVSVAPAQNLPDPKQLQYALVTLPHYGVFDALGYEVASDGSVTLWGNVLRPSLKSSAEDAVKHLKDVRKVINNVVILPVSEIDDQIRLDVFEAIYHDPALSGYGLPHAPSIHIIVNDGRVILEGAVANQTDKNLAGIRAGGVQNVRAVSNQLLLGGGKE